MPPRLRQQRNLGQRHDLPRRRWAIVQWACKPSTSPRRRNCTTPLPQPTAPPRSRSSTTSAEHGGFCSVLQGADPNARDFSLHPSILSGDIGTTGDAARTTGYRRSRSIHHQCSRISAPFSTDSTITAGNADVRRRRQQQHAGGGIFEFGGNPDPQQPHHHRQPGQRQQATTANGNSQLRIRRRHARLRRAAPTPS